MITMHKRMDTSMQLSIATTDGLFSSALRFTEKW